MKKLKDILDVFLCDDLYSIEIDYIDYQHNKINIHDVSLSINIGSNYKTFKFNLYSNIEFLNDYTFIAYDIEYKQNRVFKIKMKKYIKLK